MRNENSRREPLSVITIEDPSSSYEFGYESFLRHAARPLLETDRHGIVRLVNDRFCDMTGFDREDLIGRHVDDVLRGNGPDPGDFSDGYFAVVVRPDGSAVSFSVRDARILDTLGQTAGRMKICYAA